MLKTLKESIWPACETPGGCCCSAWNLATQLTTRPLLSSCTASTCQEMLVTTDERRPRAAVAAHRANSWYATTTVTPGSCFPLALWQFCGFGCRGWDGMGWGDSAGILGLQPKLWKPPIYKWGRVEPRALVFLVHRGFNLITFSSAEDCSRFCVRSWCSLVYGTSDQSHQVGGFMSCWKQPDMLGGIFSHVPVYSRKTSQGRWPLAFQVYPGLL